MAVKVTPVTGRRTSRISATPLVVDKKTGRRVSPITKPGVRKPVRATGVGARAPRPTRTTR